MLIHYHHVLLIHLHPLQNTQANNLVTQQCGTYAFGTSCALDNSTECDGSSNGNIKSNLFVCNRPTVEPEIGLSWLDAQLTTISINEICIHNETNRTYCKFKNDIDLYVYIVYVC